MTIAMRDTIFISHATPEDNEFTIWLASRLELMGFKVWIDKNELIGGETFWNDIESVIKNRAAKFLLVYSENICYQKQKNQIKNGIEKEINFAREVISENPDLKDFFIILHIDNSVYDLFEGSKDLNHIQFNFNWADGLSSLIKKLKKDNIPEQEFAISDKSAKWYLEKYIIRNPIIEKQENYYTNWWSVENLPEYFFIIRFSNKEQALAIQKKNDATLIVISANCLITFKRELDFEIIDGFGSNKISPADIFEIKVSELILGYEKDTFPSYRDAENHFKKLFKRALHNYLREKNLKWYEMANRNVAYYHTPTSLPSSKTAFHYPFHTEGKPKKKNLFGKYLTIGKWHYAISVKPALFPFLGFHIKSHLIFTKNGFKPLEDSDLQHSYRRNKGKRMFNEEWRDLLVAFISSLKNEEGIIQINTDSLQPIVLKNSLEMFTSNFGYNDPKDLKRQGLFNQEDREEFDEEVK
jgi:uncharacterized protein YueI